MHKFESYIDPRYSVQDDFKWLKNPELDPQKDRKEINVRILNFIAKYLLAYFDAPLPKGDVQGMLEEMGKFIRQKSNLNNQKELMALFEERGLAQKEMTPDVFLEMMLLMKDFVEKLAEKDNDDYALQVAADLHSTAAIFKEIAFGKITGAPEESYGLDLGTGIGILMPALMISAARNKIKKFLPIGIDNKASVIEGANKALARTTESYYVLQCRDLRESGVMADLKAGIPLTHWVSETISTMIPKLDVGVPDLGLPKLNAFEVMNARLDPFIYVLRGSLEDLPMFRKHVQEKEIFMFPNAVSGHYLPDNKNSVLRLETGMSPLHVPLGLVGSEFREFQNLPGAQNRWEDQEANEQLNKAFKNLMDF